MDEFSVSTAAKGQETAAETFNPLCFFFNIIMLMTSVGKNL